MQYIADLHVHSHYSRATSKDLNLESLYQWAKIKGINVVGTGDFTHPAWFAELREKLQPDGNGFFTLKNPPDDSAIPGIQTQDIDVRFCLTTEISSIYKHGDRVRKNHNLVYAPDLDTVARLNQKLASIGNLEADGRPILGLPSRDLLEIVLETSDRAYLIPAHIWTPWFSTLGSKAGYDSIDACFRDLSDHLFAVETGLSSDPVMNWKLSALDRFTLISNSDAHSPRKLGREVNLLNTEFSYDGLFDAFKTGEGFEGTYEFYPQEGKYHHDGHRKCDIAMEPEQAMQLDNTCPECGKPLTIGVLHRVTKLADRNSSTQPKGAAGYRYIIPLPEVIGEIEGVGPQTKTVTRKYRDLISAFGNEFDLLHKVPVEEIRKSKGPVMAEAIQRIRNNEVKPKAGYDGVFGVINVFEHGEVEKIRGQLGFFGGMDMQPAKTDKETKEYAAKQKSPEVQEHDAGGEYGLNEQQLKVKQSVTGATLVKAGPGTGKTHTLVEWLVHQVESADVKPGQLMAVTFTNKSAEELRKRLKNRLGTVADQITVGTFHAIAWQYLKEQRNLDTIYDGASRRMAFRFLFPELRAQERQELEEQMVAHFELAKEMTSRQREYVQRYRQYLQEQQAIDLSDIINQLVKTLKEDSEFKSRFRHKNSAIAVDEFQDINPVQYELVRELAGEHTSILAIGDPDQSIYGFRGSDLSLFFSFEEDFDAQVIPLTQNYRSAGIVLEAAGSVITNNNLNSGIKLIPNNPRGNRIVVRQSENPFREADYILDQIERYIGGVDTLAAGKHGNSQHSYGLDDIAILYRTNAVGEALNRALLKAGMPVTYGDGSSFLAEPPFTVISSLLQLQVNPDNRIALSDLLLEAYGWSQAQVTSLLGSLNEENAVLFGDEKLETIAEPLRQELQELKEIHAAIGEAITTGGLRQGVEYICEEFLSDDTLSESQQLKKQTLLTLTEEQGSDVKGFLEQMRLNPYTDAGRIRTEGVHLLTFHAAKGLEFPVVFIAAAEEEITPILKEGTDLEEERRLFYVAMTRAEEELQITYTRERSRYGEIRRMEPSRFLSEIPAELKEMTADKDSDNANPKGSESEQLGLF